jgi:hypothetical protein
MIFSTSKICANGSKIYRCAGFLSDRGALKLVKQFDYRHDPAEVIINFRFTHILGQYGAMAIAAFVLDYRSLGKAVTLMGLDADTQEICGHILDIQADNPKTLADHLQAVLIELVTI